MEKLGVILFNNVFRGRRVLVTGHTGFKGSWLALWLQELGAEIVGIALSPESTPNHWELIKVEAEDHRLDIRDADQIASLVAEVEPEIVFHLAAQPIVQRSYREPAYTWATNVMGTVNILEACRHTKNVGAIVVITTDKCYENQEWEWGYREDDRLGGHDPYSSSKAAAELVVASYRKSFFDSSRSTLLATARAGNVIGGGDWSEARLIPDLVRSLSANQSLEIRSPNATRPWQHVLESLSAYLMLGQKLLEGKREYAQAWNIGPELEGNRTVSQVLERLSRHWPEMRWHLSEKCTPHEATLLYLDTARARSVLKWCPTWQFDQAIAATAEWYRTWLDDGQIESRKQLSAYIEAAARADAEWINR